MRLSTFLSTNVKTKPMNFIWNGKKSPQPKSKYDHVFVRIARLIFCLSSSSSSLGDIIFMYETLFEWNREHQLQCHCCRCLLQKRKCVILRNRNKNNWTHTKWSLVFFCCCFHFVYAFYAKRTCAIRLDDFFPFSFHTQLPYMPMIDTFNGFDEPNMS